MVEAAGIEPDLDAHTSDSITYQKQHTSTTIATGCDGSLDSLDTDSEQVENTLKQKKCAIYVQRENETFDDEMILKSVERLPDTVKYLILNWEKFPGSMRQEILAVLKDLEDLEEKLILRTGFGSNRNSE